MYNSDQNYQPEDDENVNTQSQAISAAQQKVMKLNHSRPKNGTNYYQKQNAILGTYARIIPKKPLYDYEKIYAQNIQLREKIKFLQQDNVKTKTRLSMAEKQKQQLIYQLTNTDYGGNSLKDRRPSLKGIVKNQQKSMKIANDQNRRILHGYKDDISKLKIQNGRLKKTVKYTQIQQLQTQNKVLQEEMVRMKRYVQDVIDNLQYDQYEKQIQHLNKQLQSQKNAIRSMQNSMKKKDQQAEQLKNKIKILLSKKSQIQKKYNRDLSSVKGQLVRVKQRQKQFTTYHMDSSKSKRAQSNHHQSSCKNCLIKNQTNQKFKNKNTELQNQLKQKNKQISQMKYKLQELDRTRNQSQINLSSTNKNSKIENNSSNNNLSNAVSNKQAKKASSHQVQNKHQSSPETKQKNDQNKNKNKNQQHPEKLNKKKSSENQNEQYQDDYEQQIYKQSHGEQSQDKFDVFHVNMQNQKNGSKVQNKSPGKLQKQKEKQKKFTQTDEIYKQQDEEYEQYDDQFNDSGNLKDKRQMFKEQQSQQQQVLFKKQQLSNKNTKAQTKPVKQQKLKKQKTKQKQQPKKPEKSEKPEKNKPKQKEPQAQEKQKTGATKAQKILKQTIKYRLIAQRYTYADFNRDIQGSQAQSFSVEQLIQMLTNQPFFFTQQHLQMVMYAIFQKQELSGTDTVGVDSFLKTMKQFIGTFKLLQQKQQQKILKTIQKKLKPQNLISIMQQQSIDGRFISKKGFVKVLKQSAGLTQPQIQQCLAEASVLSSDIAHINYEQFLQKISAIHK